MNRILAIFSISILLFLILSFAIGAEVINVDYYKQVPQEKMQTRAVSSCQDKVNYYHRKWVLSGKPLDKLAHDGWKLTCKAELVKFKAYQYYKK